MSSSKSKGALPAAVDIVALAMSHQDDLGYQAVSTQIKADSKGPIYEAATEAPGLIRRISPDGSVAIGAFSSGAFHPV